MFDASVGLMSRAGIKRKDFLEFLQVAMANKNLLKLGNFVLRYIQREDGINIEIPYAPAIEVAAPVYVDAVDPEFLVKMDVPSKGLFVGNEVIFNTDTTALTLDEAILSSCGSYLTVKTTGTAVAGTVSIRVAGPSTLNGLTTDSAEYEIIVDPEA